MSQPRTIRRIDLPDGARRIHFSEDSRFLRLTNRREFVQTHIHQGNTKRVKPDQLILLDITYLTPEKIVFSTFTQDRKPKLLIYDHNVGRVIREIYTDDVRSLCVDQANQRIFAGALTGGFFEDQVGIYGFDGKVIGKFTVGAMPFDMVLSQSGDILAIGGVFEEIWDVSAKPSQIARPAFESDCTGTPCECNSIDISPDGRFVVAGYHGARGLCCVIEVKKPDEIKWLGPEGDEINFYHTTAVAISPDGKYVAVVAANFRTVLIYRVEDATLVFKYPVFPAIAVKFSPDGTLLAISTTATVSVWTFDMDIDTN